MFKGALNNLMELRIEGGVGMTLVLILMMIVTFGVIGILIDLHINSKKARKDIDEIKDVLKEIKNRVGTK